MNVVYLIGNGFDLRLGLPTSYPEFWKHYEKQPPEYESNNAQIAESIAKYKRIISKKHEEEDNDWKDLEMALGKLSVEFKDDVAGLRSFYFDLLMSLDKYLLTYDKIEPTPEEVDKFYDDITHPFQYLTENEQEELWIRISPSWDINIITFNYTSTLECLCDNALRLDETFYPRGLDASIFRGLKHIHGVLGRKEILLGVDNVDQIANISFRENESITDLMVKPQGNGVLGTSVYGDCRRLISEAHLICIFGLSLGPTDQVWWTAIKERFLADPDVSILYFCYGSSFTPGWGPDGEPKRRARQHLVDALGLGGSQKDYTDRIFVAVNSDMFPKREKLSIEPEG